MSLLIIFGEEQLTEKKINCLKNTSLDLHTDHIYSNEKEDTK